MKDLKHTKGPWKTGFNDVPGEDIITSVNNNFIAVVPVTKEAKANGRLIAAAPEMLECLIQGLKSNIEKGCKKCVSNFRDDYCIDSNCSKMRKVKTIEKATGLKIEEIIGE